MPIPRRFSNSRVPPWGPLLAAVLTLLCVVPVVACGGTADPAKRPVARVNDVILERGVLDRNRALTELGGDSLSDEDALQQAISEELIRQEAARLNVTVARAALDSRLAELAESLGGRAVLRERLADVALGAADLRAGLRAVMLGEQLQAAKFPELRASRVEARAFFDEHKASFVEPAAVDLGLIAVKREMIAADVIDRVSAGQPFESAAHQFSADPEIRAAWGKMGWVDVPALPEPIRAALEDVEAGALSTPVQYGSLWYVATAFRRRAAKAVPFTEVADEIIAGLTGERQAEALAEWVAGARKRADVEILL